MGKTLRTDKSEICFVKSDLDAISIMFSGRDWRQDNYLSLAGIYKPKKDIEESTSPAAILQFLKDHPYIEEIALHLDNDAAGHMAAKTIQNILASTYTVFDEPPKRGKDYNDYLKIVLVTQRNQEFNRL